MDTPAHIVALPKCIKDSSEQYKTARDALAPGSYDVDFTVRITGQLVVGEDTDKTPTASIPIKESLALFIHYSGITRARAVAVLQRAMAEALAKDTCCQGAIAEMLPIVDQTIESTLKPVLESLPRTPVRGSVRASLTLVEIETPALAVAFDRKPPRRRRRI